MNLFARLLDQRTEAQKARDKAAQSLAKIEEQAEKLRTEWEPHQYRVEYNFNTRNACREVLNGAKSALQSDKETLDGTFVNNPQQAGEIVQRIALRTIEIPILEGSLKRWEQTLAESIAAATKFAEANGIPRDMYPPGLA